MTENEKLDATKPLRDKPKYEKPVVIDLLEPLEAHGICNSDHSAMLDGGGGFKVG
jgi:hypothetical protein